MSSSWNHNNNNYVICVSNEDLLWTTCKRTNRYHTAKQVHFAFPLCWPRAFTEGLEMGKEIHWCKTCAVSHPQPCSQFNSHAVPPREQWADHPQRDFYIYVLLCHLLRWVRAQPYYCSTASANGRLSLTHNPPFVSRLCIQDLGRVKPWCQTTDQGLTPGHAFTAVFTNTAPERRRGTDDALPSCSLKTEGLWRTAQWQCCQVCGFPVILGHVSTATAESGV